MVGVDGEMGGIPGHFVAAGNPLFAGDDPQ
jgi:hypothetical protein